MSFFKSGVYDYMMTQLMGEIENIRAMGVVGDFVLETNLLPDDVFSYSALQKMDIKFFWGNGTVTIKKKHICPTCGSHK